MTTINLNGLEIAAIDQQRQRFGWVSLAAIVVSFVHMAAALILFSSASWYERAAALGMTALVDVATWAVAEYLDYAKRRGLARSAWIKVLFGFALAISMFLNGAYLWAHRPPEETLPGWTSAAIALAFAVFVPMLIAVASLARGELTDDRLQLQQGAQAERTARSLLPDLQGQVGSLEEELRAARARLAQREEEAAQVVAHAAQLERSTGEAVAAGAQESARLRAALEQERARAAQLEQELAQRSGTDAQLGEEAAQLRRQVAHLESQYAQTSARAAQLEARLAQVNGEAARAADEGAQLRAGRAQWERAERELRERLAQTEAELRDALTAGPLSPVTVAQRLIALGESQRRAAEFVGMKESTLRSRLAAAAQGV